MKKYGGLLQHKRKFQRLLSGALALAMVLTTIPTTFATDDYTEADNIIQNETEDSPESEFENVIEGEPEGEIEVEVEEELETEAEDEPDVIDTTDGTLSLAAQAEIWLDAESDAQQSNTGTAMYAAVFNVASTAAIPSSTIGGADNPFYVGNATILAELAELVNDGDTYGDYAYADAYYVMVDDIDVSNMDWEPIGDSTGGDAFRGDFDGDDYTVTLSADDYAEDDDTANGLFGDTYSATIFVTVEKAASADDDSGGGNTDGNLWSSYTYTFTPTNNAYTITTEEELAYFASQVNAGTTYSDVTITLDANLDLSAHEWVPVGTYTTSDDIKPFSGTFDGGGHTISGLYIDQSSSEYQGLFGYANGATIQNLTVSGTVTGSKFVGGVVGGNNDGTVENCSFAGSVFGSYYVGGVVGYNYNSATVTNCYNTGSVGGSTDSVGGVVGYNNSATVTSCYNIGAVSGTTYVGGVVGANEVGYTDCTATVSNCVSLASTITGTSDVGRVVGYNYNATASEGLYAWSGTNCASAGDYYVDGVDLYYNSSIGFYTFDEDGVAQSFSWSTICPTNDWNTEVPTYQLPNLMGEVSQNPLANLKFITITFDDGDNNTTNATLSLEMGGTLSDSDLDGINWYISTDEDKTPVTTDTQFYEDTTLTFDIVASVTATVSGDTTTYYSSLQAAVTYANGLSSASSITVKVLEDVTTANTITISRSLVLDLNDCVVTYGGSSTGSVFGVNGTTIVVTLQDTAPSKTTRYGYWDEGAYTISTTKPSVDTYDTLTGGIITGGTSGGVHVYSNDILIMTGGNIAGNTATNGGGVYVNVGGTFTMSGGTITGNTATSGGGVYVYGTFNLSGAPLIQDVYLTSGKVITLADEYTGSAIPVTAADTPAASTPVTITKDANAKAGTDSLATISSFTSAEGYIVSANDTSGEIQLSILSDCPCGQTHTDTTGDLTGWYPLTNGNIVDRYSSLSGNYYLAEDITLPSDKSIGTNGTLNLCLNGHTITGTATAEDGDSVSKPVIKVTNSKTINLYDGDYSNATENGKTIDNPTGDGAITIYGGLITGGYSSTNGGGVYVEAGGTFNLYGGTIAGNYAGNNGGGVYVAGGTGTTNSSTFHIYGGAIIGNTAAEMGGGIYLIDTSYLYPVTIQNADISYNTAQMGGGVYSNVYKLTITDSTIRNNATTCKTDDGSAGDGGGIYLAPYGNSSNTIYYNTYNTLTNVSITGNTAARTGGGVYAETKVEVTIQGDEDGNYSAIDNNTAGLNGGGIYAGSYYDGTEANPTNSTVTITGGTISGNTAQDGGGAYVSSANFSLTGTTVSGNKAVADSTSSDETPVGGDGAGIYISGKHYEGNGDGYAMDSNGAATLTDVTLKNNNAAVNGGGIYLEGNDATLAVGATEAEDGVSLKITDNDAGSNGGGVYISTGGTLSVDGKYSISDNSAAKGAGVYNIGTLELEGAPTMQDVHLGAGCVITLSDKYTGNAIPVTTATAPVDGTPVTITSGADIGTEADDKNYIATTDISSSYTISTTNGGEIQLMAEHVHDWSFANGFKTTVSDDGNNTVYYYLSSAPDTAITTAPTDGTASTYVRDTTIIVATCGNSSSTCDTPACSIQIVAPTELTYTGSAIEATLTNNLDGDIATPDIVYYQWDASSNAYSTTAMTSAPTNVGSYKAEITLGADDEGNNGTTAWVAYSVAAATLTITDVTATNFTYNGSTDVAVSGGTLSGVVDGDTVTLIATNASGSTADANAGGNKSVTITGYTISGSDAGNYSLTQPSTTVTISPLVAEFNWTLPSSLVYDSNEKTVTATVSNAVTNDTVTVTSYTNNAATVVGNYTATVTALSNSNYALSSTATDNQKEWSITNASMAAPTVASYNAAYDGNAHGITVTPADTSATVTYSSSENGEYSTTPITYTGFTNGAITVYYKVSMANYTDVTGSATVTISAAPLTLTGATIVTKVYDGTTDGTQDAISYTGNITGETPVLTGTFTWSSADAGTTGFRVSNIALTDAAVNANYSLTITSLPDQSGTTAITQATLGIAAQSMTYNGTTTYTVANLDGLTVDGTAEKITATYTPTSKNVGDYTSGTNLSVVLDDDNYKTGTVGDLTITAKEVGLAWSDNDSTNDPEFSFVYDGSPVSVTATATNLIDGDECTVTVAGGAETDKGSHTATATALSDGNYKLPSSVSQAYSITAQTVTQPTADTTVFTYNKAAQTYTLAENSLYTISGNTQTTAGTHTVTVALKDTDNYVWATSANADDLTYAFIINKAPINFSYNPSSYTYNATEQTADDDISAIWYGSDPQVDFTGYTLSYAMVSGTDTTPLNAGSYSVTATLGDGNNFYINNGSNSDQSKASYTFSSEHTISLAILIGAWENTITAYTSKAQSPSMTKFTGVIAGDGNPTASFTYSDGTTSDIDAVTAAGTYTVTATLSDSNYTLSNPTATFIIAKEPVTFTLASDGSVNASPAVGFTVSYIDSDGNATSTVPTGNDSYDVYVTIQSPDSTNYHLAGFSTSEGSIGTYTVGAREYTATFGDNVITSLAGAQVVVPAGTDSDEQTFVGWMYNNITYKAGEIFTQPSSNVTFTATYQTTYDITGTVEQAVTDSAGNPLNNVVVTLMSGSNQIAQTTTGTMNDVDGTYIFSDIPAGTYNIVVTYDGVTRTTIVTITDTDVTIATITMPAGITNSIVDVTAGSPDVIVGGLDTIFEGTDDTAYTEGDAEVVADGGSVELVLAVEEVTATTTVAEIEEVAENVGTYLDITITKTVDDGNAITSTTISQVPDVLTFIIPIPADYQGKQSYSIYREHDGEVSEITTVANTNGEYISVNDAKTEITLYAKYFSTYALAYTEYSENTSVRDTTTTYDVDIDSTQNGDISVDKDEAKRYATVTITAEPDSGYAVDEVVVLDEDGDEITVTDNGDGTYSFMMPSGDVTINVTFVESDGIAAADTDTAQFTDVSDNDWFYDAVLWAVENGITAGMGDGTFAPSATTTRAQAVTFLWRSAGEQSVNADAAAQAFLDAEPDGYYYDAMVWAVENAITNGTSDTTFSPYVDCSRAHIITFLWRMMGQPVADDTTAFVDVSSSDYYYQAVLWAVAEGITAGTSDTTFSPDQQCTRAEIVTFLYRCLGE